jgi:hypothetical protein
MLHISWVSKWQPAIFFIWTYLCKRYPKRMSPQKTQFPLVVETPFSLDLHKCVHPALAGVLDDAIKWILLILFFSTGFLCLSWLFRFYYAFCFVVDCVSVIAASHDANILVISWNCSTHVSWNHSSHGIKSGYVYHTMSWQNSLCRT